MTAKIIPLLFMSLVTLRANATDVVIPKDKALHVGVSAVSVLIFPDDPVLGFLAVNAAGVFKEYALDPKPDNYDILANVIGSSFGLVLRVTF